jgi:small subunit ribosomal protein S9
LIIEEPDQTPDAPEPEESEVPEPTTEDAPPAEETPTEEPPAAEEPPAEEAPAEEPPAEEAPAEEAPAEEAPAEEAPAEEAPAEEAPAEEAPAEEPAPAEPVPEEPAGEPAAAETPPQPEAEATPAAEPKPPAEKPKAKDQAPGADLEPIALEPERELSIEERSRLEAEEEERAQLEAGADVGDEPVARSGPQVELAADARIQATGKRKSAIARVILRPGNGTCQINGKPLDEYFPRQSLRTMARQPLLTAGYESSVDVQVRVHGGGIAGQAGAVRHGIARALTDIDPELRSELKRRGLLTRDARKKERRKAGLKKARKKPQFSKR